MPHIAPHLRSKPATALNAPAKQRTTTPPSILEHAPSTSATSHRLFVGGCPSDLSAAQLHDELQRRFQSFGNVTRVDVVGSGQSLRADTAVEQSAGTDNVQMQPALTSRVSCVRGAESLKGFAYVDLVSSRVADALAAFRGTTWRGQRFRVELAKEDYQTRLRRQWEDEQAAQQSALSHPEPSPPSPPPPPPPSSVDCTARELRLRVRPGHRITVRPRPPHTAFEHIPALPVSQQSPLEEAAVPGAVREAETEEERKEDNAGELSARLQRWKAEVEQRWLPVQVVEEPKRLTKLALLKARRVEEKRAKRTAQRGVAAVHDSDDGGDDSDALPHFDLEREEQRGTIDFLSDDEAGQQGQSDSDDEGLSLQEREKRKEDEEWAMLEGEDDEAESADEDDAPSPQRRPVIRAAEPDGQKMQEIEEQWAEDDDQPDQPAPTVDRPAQDNGIEGKVTAPSSRPMAFPKRTVREWFDDSEEDEDGAASSPQFPASSAESRMQSLSSALVTSGSEFNIRPVYEGESGQRLLQLKRTFKGDERFSLDDRFAQAAKDEELGLRADSAHVEGEFEAGEEEKEQPSEQPLAVAEAELRQQLHAEMLRALQVLDEVAPGPSKFHQTLPRFSGPSAATQSAVADGDKDARMFESELNAAEARKSVLLWRKVDRFDPDIDDRKLHPHTPDHVDVDEGSTELRSNNAGKKKRKTQAKKEESGGHRRQPPVGDASAAAVGVDEPQLRFSRSFEVAVPRLRDLITDRSTVVQFSVAADAAQSTDDRDDGRTETNVVSTIGDFPTKPASASLPPLVTAPVGLSSSALLRRKRSAHVPIPGRASAPPPALAPSAASAAPVSVEPPHRLSDLLAFAAQTHSASVVGEKAGGAIGDDSDEDEGASFVRGDASQIEVAWRASREALRTDYRKKSKEAGKKEALKQSASLTAPRRGKRPPSNTDASAGHPASRAKRGGKKAGF